MVKQKLHKLKIAESKNSLFIFFRYTHTHIYTIVNADYSGTNMILKNPNKYGFDSYMPSSKAFSHGVTSLLYASMGWAQGLQVCHWHILIGRLAKTWANCCNTKNKKHQKKNLEERNTISILGLFLHFEDLQLSKKQQ